MTSWMFVGKLLPAHRRAQRGQTLIIFAFLAVFMILLLGLVLDTVRLFILTAQAERVAEAASLAGALYMPDYFDQSNPAPDGQYAVKRACDVARENGITNCPAATGQVGAAVTQVTGNQYQVQVTVTLQADVYFLAYVAPNLASATVSRPAIAEYLPPIQLGSRSATFGDESTSDYVNGQPLQQFWAHINGPSEIKESGDAYSPSYEEGPTNAKTYSDGGTYHLDRFPSQSWTTTNHPQYGGYGSYITNPDQQPTGFTGSGGTAGYNYEIVVPSGSTPVTINIYNAAFSPGDNGFDDLGASCFDPSYYVYLILSLTCTSDQGGEYMQLTYSLYSAPVQFERSQDTLISAATLTPASLDLYSSDIRLHCGSTSTYKAYNPVARTCLTSIPSTVDNWTSMYTITTPGTYRLVVAATGTYGRHHYGIKLTDSTGAIASSASGVRIWGWNNMCVYFNSTSSSGATFDLGEIPADYAGKTLTFSLFDPGDSTGNVYMEILDPSGNAVQLPSWLRTTNGGTKLEASLNGDRIYNGLWLNIPITIPSTYNPTAGNDWWQVRYTTPSGTPTDVVTISISLSGSPIHLVNEVVN